MAKLKKQKSKSTLIKKKLLTSKELSLLPNHKQIRFAIFCANQVIHLVPTEHKEVCLKAIGCAELYLVGKASKEECRAAASAADDAANVADAADAAANAAYSAAAYTANAAANAAYYAVYANPSKERQAVINAQYYLYDQLLNEDRIFEEIVLKGVV